MALSRLLFSLFSFFNTVASKQISNIYIYADDWIRTVDLWIWKRLLYQLSHNLCPYNKS